MITLVYKGKKPAFIYGVPSGRRYRAGTAFPRVVVVESDVPHLLSILEDGEQVFWREDVATGDTKDSSGESGDITSETVRGDDLSSEGQVPDLVPDPGTGPIGSSQPRRSRGRPRGSKQ